MPVTWSVPIGLPAREHPKNEEDISIGVEVRVKGEQDAPIAYAQAPLSLASPQLFDIAMTGIRQSINRRAHSLPSPLIKTAQILLGRG